MPNTKKTADPIFAAIADAKRLEKIWMRLYDGLQRAEYRARKKHGRRPWSLIRWRNYSAIGGSEIDKARKQFLSERLVPRKEIEKEYLAAKARERAGERAEIAWDKRAGITTQRREFKKGLEATRRAHIRMATTRPTTPAGAGAMLAYVKTDMEGGDCEWHATAIETIVAALKAWGIKRPGA